MSRAIDADAMLVRLEEWNTSDPTDKALYNFTLNRIQEQPTIEPERKTDCAGCKHGRFGDTACAKCARAFTDMYEEERDD